MWGSSFYANDHLHLHIFVPATKVLFIMKLGIKWKVYCGADAMGMSLIHSNKEKHCRITMTHKENQSTKERKEFYIDIQC